MIAPMVNFDVVPVAEANAMLDQWGHLMGPCNRPFEDSTWCHALFHEGQPVAVTITTSLVRDHVGGGLGYMTRDNTVELARLCAARPALCRAALRLWREFVFPSLGKPIAISYQDATNHRGEIYRCDGWKRAGFSSSGTDQRSGRVGRRKWIWVWPPAAVKR